LLRRGRMPLTTLKGSNASRFSCERHCVVSVMIPWRFTYLCWNIPEDAVRQLAGELIKRIDEAPQRSQGIILLSITSLASKARRRIDRSRLFRSCAKSRFHLASQFQPQGFEDCRPLPGHWVGWITNHFAGNMAAAVIQFLQQVRPNSPSRRCRKTYAQASDRRCFS
jgi:hypothetical protein